VSRTSNTHTTVTHHTVTHHTVVTHHVVVHHHYYGRYYGPGPGGGLPFWIVLLLVLIALGIWWGRRSRD
jgi:hypothetical protein